MQDNGLRHLLRPLLVVAVILLISGCGGGTARTATTPAPSGTTPSAAAPTPTTPGPLTAGELAWLSAITRLRHNMDKALMTESSVTLTPNKLRSWETTMRGCGRELTRLGAPSERLQPVRVLAAKACQQYDKGAACYEAAARNLYSATKVVEQKVDCGFTASGDGSNLLGEAVTKGQEIEDAAG